MLTRLALVGFVALFSLSGPPSQRDEIAALRKKVETLKAQQAAMQRDLAAIKQFLQQLLAQNTPAPGEALLDKTVSVAGLPAKGAPTAPLTIVEVSDYHCPFCRRHRQQTQPRLEADYVATGKVRYTFIDFPIEQLHPGAFRAHEAANCAGDQGKYWEMNARLFEEPTREDARLVEQAQRIGLDAGVFRACLDAGKYATPVRASVARMADLGIASTPTFLIGRTPARDEPLKILKVIEGAMPYEEFQKTLDGMMD
jgi:protein-disulfide isomerase